MKTDKEKKQECECETGKAVKKHSSRCPHMNDLFNKNHQDELNKSKGERIKNNVEDGENFSGI